MIKKIILPAIYTGIVLCISIISIYKPDYNWDTLPYVASAYSLELHDTNIVHNNAYEVVKKSIPPQAYELLTTNNKYREEMLVCAACFYQQLPFYRIRPLYVVLIYTFYKLGLNIVISPFIISGLSYFLICLICFFWLKKISKDQVLVFIVSILLAIGPFLLSSATEASPNALSGLITLGALYSFLRGKFMLFLVLMLISVFARPDNLLAAILYSSTLLIYKGDNIITRKYFIVSAVILAVLAFVIINRWSGNYEWAVWFEHTFKNRIFTPAQYSAEFSLGGYLKSFLKWAILFKSAVFALQMIIFISILYMKPLRLRELRNDLELLVIIAIGLSIVLHYLIYPALDDKYFISQYLAIDIIFIRNLIDKSRPGISESKVSIT